MSVQRTQARNPAAPRGSTLVVVLGATVIAAAVLITLVEGSASNSQSTNTFVDSQGTYYAAQGATELARSEVWGGYLVKATANPSLDFGNYLKSRFVWNQISSTPTSSGLTTICSTQVNDWSNLKLGNRVISKLYLYYRERDLYFPGTTTIKQKVYDIAVQAESQKDLGFATGPEQDAAFGTGSVSDTARATQAFANSVSSFMTVTCPPAYHGLEYGLLTKNVQCMLCHMRVSSAQKYFNKDPKKFNSFPRVKVGSTDSMGISASPDTQIDGTLYQRGNMVEDATGLPITSATAASRMASAVLNANSSIKQDSNGNCTYVMDTQTSSKSGAPAVNGNFYGKYSASTALESDGILPNSTYPSAFPEIPQSTDNNRNNYKVDPGEVALAMTDAVARSNPNNPGTVQGGVALVLPAGTAYTQTSLPSAGGAANISQGVSGNVILVGTQDNPIQLDGKVVIDGDLIIRGYVQGTGQLSVSGNIYIPGDVIYKDGTSTVHTGSNGNGNGDGNGNGSGGGQTVQQENFGTDPSGNTNLLGLMAGKNIVVGDYLSQVTYWWEGYFNFNYDGQTMSYVNPDFFSPRKQVGNTVVTLQGQPEPGRILTYQQDGYLNPTWNSVTPNAYTLGPDNNYYGTISQPNYTMFQLSLFNQQEYVRTLNSLPDYGPANPYDPTNAAAYRVPNTADNNPNTPYDATYIPRYYSFYKYDPANPQNTPVYVYTQGWQQSPVEGGNGGAWDTTTKQFDLVRQSSDPISLTDLSTIPASVQSPAAVNSKTVLNIHPDWIDPNTMMQIISSEETQRQSGTRRIDGLLYTNNALLATERALANVYNPATNTWTTTAAKGNGNIQINGAAIAPDMGVMASDGKFQMNFDARIPGFATVQPGIGVNLTVAQTYDMIKKGVVKQDGPIAMASTSLNNTSSNGGGSNGSPGGSGGGSNGGGSNGSGSGGSTTTATFTVAPTTTPFGN